MSGWIVGTGTRPVKPGGLPPIDYSGAPKCDHPTVEVRLDTLPNGKTRYREQCIVCGIGRGIVGANKVKSFGDLKKFDPDLEKAWREKVDAFYRQQREKDAQAVRQHDAQWWAWYDGYLQSAEWRARRAKVLQRDNYRCMGCLGAPATQVHHLTYAHVGNELLWELISVCDFCHEKCHVSE